jgi:AraC-like DNA-binding protein
MYLLCDTANDACDPWFAWLASVIIFGTYMGLLSTVGQLVLARKKTLNYLLALLFLGLGLLQGTVLLFALGLSAQWPRLIVLHLPVLACIGPILYSIHKIIQDPALEGEIVGLGPKHALLPFAFLVGYGTLALVPERLLVEQLDAFRAGTAVWYIELLYEVPGAAVLLYILALVRESRDLFRLTVLREEWTARVLLYLVAATFANHSVAGLYLLTRNVYFLLISSAMMAGSLCVAYLIGRWQPAYFQNLQEVAQANRRRYARSLLTGADLETLRENLIHTMERDRLYRDEDLSLSSLADDLAISPHQLSEFMNQNLGKNFAAFVNGYRVQEACDLLSGDPGRSILDIGYEVGFRSKTSFHRAFVRFTGTTPSAYRETHKLDPQKI